MKTAVMKQTGENNKNWKGRNSIRIWDGIGWLRLLVKCFLRWYWMAETTSQKVTS